MQQPRRRQQKRDVNRRGELGAFGSLADPVRGAGIGPEPDHKELSIDSRRDAHWVPRLLYAAESAGGVRCERRVVRAGSDGLKCGRFFKFEFEFEF